MTRAEMVTRIRPVVTAARKRAAKPLKEAGLADWLILGGFSSAVAGCVQLFGWPVTLLAFGLLALVAGVVVVVFEARSR